MNNLDIINAMIGYLYKSGDGNVYAVPHDCILNLPNSFKHSATPLARLACGKEVWCFYTQSTLINDNAFKDTCAELIPFILLPTNVTKRAFLTTIDETGTYSQHSMSMPELVQLYQDSFEDRFSFMFNGDNIFPQIQFSKESWYLAKAKELLR